MRLKKKLGVGFGGLVVIIALMGYLSYSTVRQLGLLETLQSAPAEQASQPEPKKLGEILVGKGAVSPVEIGEALARQRVASETQSDANRTRLDVRKLDEPVNLIGELVLERNRLVRLSHDLSAGVLDRSAFDMALGQSTARLSFVTEELQNASLKIRMVPIESVFRKFPRLVRDVARSVNKQVQLVLEGQDTEIDKTIVELIANPLVHLVRNALDHGIELPEIREKTGKPREGTIRLEASQEGDLSPTGYFFLGQSESLYGLSDQFKIVHFPSATGYMKVQPQPAGK